MYLDYIKDIVESFYYCTHMPIRVYDLDNKVIGSAGYDNNLETLIERNEIKEEFNQVILSESPFIKHIKKDDICFSILAICPGSIKKGYYLLGPYVTKKKLKLNISYRPSFCIKYIITLLYSIVDKLVPATLNKAIESSFYSFHIQKAIGFIEKNYSDNITLDAISKYLNINKSYFCTIFKKETGKTYSEYLNEFRITKSEELLLNQNLSLLDISLSVGFNSQSYYTMVFKKLRNKTPLEYRNYG